MTDSEWHFLDINITETKDKNELKTGLVRKMFFLIKQSNTTERNCDLLFQAIHKHDKRTNYYVPFETYEERSPNY